MSALHLVEAAVCAGQQLVPLGAIGGKDADPIGDVDPAS
jgi:hypothetical protein